jgi:uncharacterized protein with FMN-binding domain
MRARIVVGGILSSAAVLVVGWQLGGQPAVTAGLAPSAGSGTASSGSGTTGTSGTGGTSSGTSTSSPSAAAGSGTSGSGSSASGSSASGSSVSGSSVSGTFDGTTTQTQYGPVQVEIVVSAGRITDVKALQLTDRGGRSVAISASAAPILRQEAIAAQSADIQAVSGATYTSDGYTTSLQSAIDQAGL